MNDELDEQIIQLLEQDASQSSRVYAKHLHASSATVRRRIAKLLKKDVIQIKAMRNPSKAGRDLSVLLVLDIDHNKINAAVEFLTERDNVEWLSTITGRYHISVLLRFASTDEFHAFLRDELSKIEGLKHDEAFLCLNIIKAPYIQKIK
jgi:DNA-binding Lrp family transcriptional regulator